MTTYNWTISQCDRQISDGFITVAHWRCVAVDGDFTASFQIAPTAYGACGFPAGTPTIPYADVTEQDVLDWCWANGVDKDATEAALSAQIEALKHPTTASGTPWNTAA